MAPERLTILCTTDRNKRRKDMVDRVLLQAITHRVRRPDTRSPGDVVVIAGADHLDQATLEDLSRHARRTGLRLVLMFEHLRGDLQQLVGDSDSATIVMRLGNGREAGAAAEFIGRGHTFILTRSRAKPA